MPKESPALVIARARERLEEELLAADARPERVLSLSRALDWLLGRAMRVRRARFVRAPLRAVRRRRPRVYPRASLMTPLR